MASEESIPTITSLDNSNNIIKSDDRSITGSGIQFFKSLDSQIRSIGAQLGRGISAGLAAAAEVVVPVLEDESIPFLSHPIGSNVSLSYETAWLELRHRARVNEKKLKHVDKALRRVSKRVMKEHESWIAFERELHSLLPVQTMVEKTLEQIECVCDKFNRLESALALVTAQKQGSEIIDIDAFCDKEQTKVQEMVDRSLRDSEEALEQAALKAERDRALEKQRALDDQFRMAMQEYKTKTNAGNHKSKSTKNTRKASKQGRKSKRKGKKKPEPENTAVRSNSQDESEEVLDTFFHDLGTPLIPAHEALEEWLADVPQAEIAVTTVEHPKETEQAVEK